MTSAYLLVSVCRSSVIWERAGAVLRLLWAFFFFSWLLAAKQQAVLPIIICHTKMVILFNFPATVYGMHSPWIHPTIPCATCNLRQDWA